MSESESHESEPLLLTSQEAAEIKFSQELICEMLDAHPNVRMDEIPVEMQEDVKLHVITCEESVHHVDGITFGSE